MSQRNHTIDRTKNNRGQLKRDQSSKMPWIAVGRAPGVQRHPIPRSDKISSADVATRNARAAASTTRRDLAPRPSPLALLRLNVFKNARIFRLSAEADAAATPAETSRWQFAARQPPTIDQLQTLQAQLAQHAFRPCGPLESLALGWIAPLGGGAATRFAPNCCRRRSRAPGSCRRGLTQRPVGRWWMPPALRGPKRY